MRPQVGVSRRMAHGVCRRFKTTSTSNDLQRFKLQEDEPAPFVKTALGSEVPDYVPETPLHLDQLSPRRLRFLARTINKEKMGDEEEAVLERAMSRYEKSQRPTIDYVTGESGPSQERMNFFSDGEVDGSVVEAEDEVGLERGRVIEYRRYVS